MKLALTVQTPEVPVLLPVALLSGSFEEKLQKAAAFGADGVELVPTEPAGVDRAWMRRLLDKNGLQISAVASGAMAFAAKLTLLNPDAQVSAVARQRLDEMIVLAGDLGAPVVTIGTFRGFVREAQGQTRKDFLEILSRAGDLAAGHGVKLAIEPLNRYEGNLISNAGEGLALMEELGHPAVGLLLDTYHMNIEEASRTEPFCRVMAAGKLFHVHIGDNNRLPPGRGMIDFGEILAVLKEIEYSGWMTAELLSRPDADTAAQQTLEHLHRILKGSQ